MRTEGHDGPSPVSTSPPLKPQCIGASWSVHPGQCHAEGGELVGQVGRGVSPCSAAPGCVALGKLLKISGAQFPHLSEGNQRRLSLPSLLRRSRVARHVHGGARSRAAPIGKLPSAPSALSPAGRHCHPRKHCPQWARHVGEGSWKAKAGLQARQSVLTPLLASYVQQAASLSGAWWHRDSHVGLVVLPGLWANRNGCSPCRVAHGYVGSLARRSSFRREEPQGCGPGGPP